MSAGDLAGEVLVPQDDNGVEIPIVRGAMFNSPTLDPPPESGATPHGFFEPDGELDPDVDYFIPGKKTLIPRGSWHIDETGKHVFGKSEGPKR